jgi:hypothetical protein
VRNSDFILDVLRDVLPTMGVILEIASGSGEHVVHFAKCFPRLVFQPSDPDPDARFSIAAWTKAAGVENVHAPIALDVSEPVWPIASADGIICNIPTDRRSIPMVRTYAKAPQRPRATKRSSGASRSQSALGSAGPRGDFRSRTPLGSRLVITEMPANNLGAVFRQM